MALLTYIALGFVLAALTLNTKAIKLALPVLYVRYLNETQVEGHDPVKPSTFNKAMVTGLLVIYGVAWPVLLIRILYKLLKGKDGGNPPQAPQTLQPA